ncbi:hypothetical protein [Cellvibrio japonicus]|uniref:Uncharacterized protein n=1 Tax=Cellvibrio japonicus (strain Ueda107) TaxID=498211 RepID=B3PKK0_CELJU|nr:hypothetical protein [Cellvibrio japonicus]ACE85940.1 hypothetical protein CJA_2468 [Cellvibrio japonicus Ueda107]QEI12862.1 hypothetical protein FY117_11910 [Cellvibrio japonicus]QEI16436.1 hypothetical protein FY116_11915 [Cellvibrio japonicus]QEI20014.1 hypothetical protein FY115_11910 [Cellvibrio japonicus]
MGKAVHYRLLVIGIAITAGVYANENHNTIPVLEETLISTPPSQALLTGQIAQGDLVLDRPGTIDKIISVTRCVIDWQLDADCKLGNGIVISPSDAPQPQPTDKNPLPSTNPLTTIQ